MASTQEPYEGCCDHILFRNGDPLDIQNKSELENNRLGQVLLKIIHEVTQKRRPQSPLRKHAYSNILKILPPKNENFQIKNSDIFTFLLKA